MADFIEVMQKLTGEPMLVNLTDISTVLPMGNECYMFTKDDTEIRVRESYKTIRLMIGRAKGPITTAAEVKMSEVE